MQQLLDALTSMDRQDAIVIVREALKYHRQASNQSKHPMIIY